MNKFEKTITALLLLGVCIQIIDFEEVEVLGFAFIWLLLWILAVSYGVGGFWILQGSKLKWPPLSVLAGIAFATSIFILPLKMAVIYNPLFYYLFGINAIFFFSIGIFLWRERSRQAEFKPEFSLFIRSTIILFFTSIFLFIPLEFKPYRFVLSVLIRGDESIENNLKLYDYQALFLEAKEKGDCESAIDYALKARAAGRAWLEILYFQKTIEELEIEKWLESGSIETHISLTRTDSSHIYTDKINLNRMGAVATALYEAYECKANKEYEAGRFEKALLYYSVSRNYLNSYGDLPKNWNKQNAWSASNMAHCYSEMKQYGKADSLHEEAIRIYSGIEKEPDWRLARLVNNLALSLNEQNRFSESNQYYKVALSYLIKDSTNVDSKREMKKTLLNITSNYLRSDSLNLAFRFVRMARKVKLESDDPLNCKTRRYVGFCNNRSNKYKEAESDFTASLTCYLGSKEKNNQDIPWCQHDLAKVQIVLAKYKEARATINEGMETITKGVDLGDFLETSSSLYMLTGNYDKSETELFEALRLYENEVGKTDYQLIPLLTKLAELEVQLDRSATAKAYLDRANLLARANGDFNSRYHMGLRQTTGYVQYSQGNYKAADTSYRRLMNDLLLRGKEKNSMMASVLNGLGLVALARSKYHEADSLFSASLKIYISLLTENNPATATVMLNQAHVFLEQRKLSEAENYIIKAEVINRKFLDPTNDVFGNILMAYGDLALLKNENAKSKECYQKALIIFENKFGPSHIKAREAKRKAG